MTHEGAEDVATARFAEDVQGLGQQLATLAPGGIIQGHGQGRLRHGPQVAAHFVSGHQQVGKADQRKTVLQGGPQRGGGRAGGRDAGQHPDGQGAEVLLAGAQLEQQPSHGQDARVAGADHADRGPGSGSGQGVAAAFHLALHAGLDEALAVDAVADEIHIFAVPGHGIATAQGGVHFGCELGRIAGAQAHHQHFAVPGRGGHGRRGICRRDRSRFAVFLFRRAGDG